MPASLRSPTSTSFGHFSPALIPVTPATASRTARPVASGSQPHREGGTSPAPTPTDIVIAARGAADQVRSCRPRPAV